MKVLQTAGATKHKELDDLVQKLAGELILRINKLVPGVKPDRKNMPYPHQYVVEEIIKVLEKKV